MPEGLGALHALERDVMEVVWSMEDSTVREILDAVNRRHPARPRAYTTIMTTVHRLERKGFLRRDATRRRHRFAPSIDEADYALARADHLVAELGDAALAAFARRVDELDADRLRHLRRLAGDA